MLVTLATATVARVPFRQALPFVVGASVEIDAHIETCIS